MLALGLGFGGRGRFGIGLGGPGDGRRQTGRTGGIHIVEDQARRARLELHENGEVKKNILTYGVIRVLKCPKLDFPSALDDIG